MIFNESLTSKLRLLAREQITGLLVVRRGDTDRRLATKALEYCRELSGSSFANWLLWWRYRHSLAERRF